MTLSTLITRYLPALALAVLLVGSAVAQDAANGSEANGDARADYAAAIEAAQEAAAAGTAEGHLQAAEHYLAAAEVAEASGDAELAANAQPVREAAVRAYTDAAATFANEQAFAEAAETFLLAAAGAEALGDQELQARMIVNARTAQIQGAVALQREGDVEAALTAFSEIATAAEAAADAETAARAREGAGRIHLVAARDAIQAQNFRGAIEALDSAADFLPEDDGNLNTFYANAYYRLGVSQVQAEQYQAARTSLQRAQEHARVVGRDQIVHGAQQQLDFIREVTNN